MSVRRSTYGRCNAVAATAEWALIDATTGCFQIEASLRMSKHDLAARPM